MSRASLEYLPIGPVQIYWNNVRLGSPRSNATVRYSKETVQFGYEDSTVNVGSYKTKETCEVDVTIADFKIENLRYVYDQASSMTARSTLDSASYKDNQSTVFRFKEEIKLSGTASAALAQGGFVVNTITVMKMDNTTTYTKGSDYSATGGTIKRLGASTISTGDTVMVFYNQSATADSVLVGGKFADFEAELRLVHILDTGKSLQFRFYRAKKIGASDTAINMADAFPGIPMTFHCLGDMTYAPGQQIFRVDKEV